MARLEEVPDEGSSSAHAFTANLRHRQRHHSSSTHTSAQPVKTTIKPDVDVDDIEHDRYEDEKQGDYEIEEDGLPDDIHQYIDTPEVQTLLGKIQSPASFFSPRSTSTGLRSDTDTDKDEDDGSNFAEEVFDTALMTVPFTFLFVLLDILVHMQYRHRATLAGIASRLLTAVPTLAIVLFYTTRHANRTLTRSILMAASILSGYRLIWLVNKASWSITTEQAPAMGTIWILTIVQLPLSRALIALLGVAGSVWWRGLKVYP